VIGKIVKNIFANFQTFLIVWVVIIIVNQLAIFGACFAPYCLIAALPHTSIIAAVISYFISDSEETNSNAQTKNHYQQIKNDVDDFEETKIPFCPKCGDKMVLRTARQGKYSGENFWGCTAFPKCKGILKQ
jgi:predicted RNA-binding Zn-ribbon protein involved in translation (DUF1610 family)